MSDTEVQQNTLQDRKLAPLVELGFKEADLDKGYRDIVIKYREWVDSMWMENKSDALLKMK